MIHREVLDLLAQPLFETLALEREDRVRIVLVGVDPNSNLLIAELFHRRQRPRVPAVAMHDRPNWCPIFELARKLRRSGNSTTSISDLVVVALLMDPSLVGERLIDEDPELLVAVEARLAALPV